MTPGLLCEPRCDDDAGGAATEHEIVEHGVVVPVIRVVLLEVLGVLSEIWLCLLDSLRHGQPRWISSRISL